jgi:hypothetical protein
MMGRLKFSGYQLVWGTVFMVCVFVGLWLWST